MVVDIEQLIAVSETLRLKDIDAANQKHAERIRTLKELAGEASALQPAATEAVETAPPVNRHHGVRPPAKRIGRPPSRLSSLPVSRGRAVSSPTAVVREAIGQLSDGFTMPVIAQWVEKHYPHAAVKRAYFSSALNKLAQMGEIVQVQKPTGRDPAVYNRGPRWRQRLPDALASENGQ